MPLFFMLTGRLGVAIFKSWKRGVGPQTNGEMKMTAIYIHTNNQPIEDAERFESLEDAAHHVLGYDVQSCGIDEEVEDDVGIYYVPWQRKMDGRKVWWTVAASFNLQEAYDNVLRLADDDIFWVYWSQADYDAACAEIEADADEDE